MKIFLFTDFVVRSVDDSFETACVVIQSYNLISRACNVNNTLTNDELNRGSIRKFGRVESRDSERNRHDIIFRDHECRRRRVRTPERRSAGGE
jgi:hypothetical protein